MPIDKREWDKFFKMFEVFNKGKLLKGYTYTAVKKNAQKGKDLFKKFKYKDSLDGFVTNGLMKSGFGSSPRFYITNRSKYINGEDELISSVYNKRKWKNKNAKGFKSGFHYGESGYNYIDRFVYKKFGSPVEAYKKELEQDFEKGVKQAIKDAMKKGGFD